MAKQLEIKVVEFPLGTIEPLFVAARDVPRVIIGLSKSTLANWRCLKKGPPFQIVGGVPYYSWSELKEFFAAGRVETFNEPERTLAEDEI